MTQEVVSKGEFARRKGRNPSAVSRWIASGIISAAALVGSGMRAKIIVEQAERDLAEALDLGQQLRHPRPAIGAEPGPVSTPVVDGPGGLLHREAIPSPSPAEEYARRERFARMERAEAEAKAAQLRNAREEGRWIEAAAAEQAWGRELARVLADTEAFLGNALARQLAERHGLDFKAVAVEIRAAWRLHRQGMADRAADALATPAGDEVAA